MASIIVTSEKQKGEYLPLGRRTSVIGRDEAISLQILDDLVSRKHLRISFEKVANKYYAEDMKNKHDVFINRSKITEDTVLSDGESAVYQERPSENSWNKPDQNRPTEILSFGTHHEPD